MEERRRDRRGGGVREGEEGGMGGSRRMREGRGEEGAGGDVRE